MIQHSYILLHNAMIVTGESAKTGSVAICGERIYNLWYPDENGLTEFDDKHIPYAHLTDFFKANHKNAEVIDVSGKILMAGGIDTHVHFREPGLTEKADIASESLAAIAGGVTSFIDMPNTTPPTISKERLIQKLDSAKNRSYANFGFHFGATNNNYDEIADLLKNDSTIFGGIKVFMGSSTGNMLVDNESVLHKIFASTEKEVLVHCEDESIIRHNMSEAQEKFGEDIPFSEHEHIRSRKACIRSSAKALEYAIKHGTRLHLLHISTAEEIEMVRAAKQLNKNITAETSANYLWFSNCDYDKMGSRLKCNPSVKGLADRDTLRNALHDGTIDTIGTDHAPHLADEKDRKYMSAPSGLPSVQQSLSVLLSIADEQDIPLTRIASVFSEKPAEIFGIHDRGKIRKGYYADIVIVDEAKEFTVTQKELLYKCGWSPYEGIKLKGKIDTVFVNGIKTIQNGYPITDSPVGQPLVFTK